jgi:hypothetical protein
MTNAVASMLATAFNVLLRDRSDVVVVVHVGLGLADFPLGLSLQLLAFPLDLLTRVASESADRVPDFALGLLANAFDLVLETIAIEIVRHLLPRHKRTDSFWSYLPGPQ